MALVTGNLKDITGGLLDTREGVVCFTLNRGNLRLTNGNVIPDNFREAVPNADGEFSINLEPTEQMALNAWYSVSVLWIQQPDTGFQKPRALTSYVDLIIRVPSAGGAIEDLIETSPTGGSGANPNIWWVSADEYPPSRSFTWLVTDPEDPDRETSGISGTTIGDVKVWR